MPIVPFATFCADGTIPISRSHFPDDLDMIRKAYPMKIRRLTAATLSCLALTVVAPASANAFTLVDLLPKGVAI